MIDINFIRKNPQVVLRGAQAKGVDVDIKKFLDIDKARSLLIERRDSLRSHRKPSQKPNQAELLKIRKSNQKLKVIEEELKIVQTEWEGLMLQIPNMPLASVRYGKDESENRTLREVGKPRKLSFKPKGHIELTEELNYIDTKRAAKVSGTRFGYLKGPVAELELALINYTFEILTKEGFVTVFPPVLVGERAMEAMGYLEHGGENETYHFKEDKLYLVGTSEQSIGPMHMDETLPEQSLPLRYAAFSTCFRREAGSYGKDTKGILRVHQFDKIEMFSFVTPDDSEREHDFLLSLEEKITKGLGLPYRVIDICSGDLGAPAAKKWDIEVWMPSQNCYRETHSTSNCTDFQARRLNIKLRRDNGKKEYLHTLNGTAAAIGRMLIGIIENYQNEDGSIEVPEILQKYTNFKKF